MKEEKQICNSFSFVEEVARLFLIEMAKLNIFCQWTNTSSYTYQYPTNDIKCKRKLVTVFYELQTNSLRENLDAKKEQTQKVCFHSPETSEYYFYFVDDNFCISDEICHLYQFLLREKNQFIIEIIHQSSSSIDISSSSS